MTRMATMTFVLTLGATGAALAQAQLRNDPNRPTELIAADLGVSQDQFIACFYNVEPDPDFKPTRAQEEANKAVLLPCLQAANPEITNDGLDAVMDRYRPG
ncbi:hypothetical protein [Frigidibacter sp. ROC022]|uniref:hypothetical protein n=1 Tax=Frigidibacter sp. ROC022 TaxID=2971796 RepID=UPI00215A82F5|nr:hypothetical protein [Frigidibacter sp. ROC022]MCR8722792.1 hypothetical protein [Frigidibacter sp. ROC022]